MRPESEFADWFVKGPRTLRWLLVAMATQGLTPIQRHYWWRNVLSLTASDPFVDYHLFLSELLGTALVYDQLNIPDLAAFEMAARRYQLYKEIYANSLRSAEGGEGADLWLDERQLCLGHDRSRGKALVCPELEACVASQSSVLKERRMGREELSLASGAGGDRNEGGGAARARVDARA